MSCIHMVSESTKAIVVDFFLILVSYTHTKWVLNPRTCPSFGKHL